MAQELRAIDRHAKLGADEDNVFLKDKLAQKHDPTKAAELQRLQTQENTVTKEMQRQQRMTVPAGFVLRELETMGEARHLMREFVLHIPFLVMFVVWLFARVSVPQLYFNHSALYNLLVVKPLPPTNNFTGGANDQPYFPKPFLEIGNFGDIYDWLESVAGPSLFPVNESRVLDEQVRLLQQDMPLGAVRFRAKHVRSDSCTSSVNTQWYGPEKTFPRLCYAPYSSDAELKTTLSLVSPYSWTFSDCSDYWRTIGGQYATYDCSGFYVDMPFNTTTSTAMNQLHTFRLGHFAYTVSLRYFGVEFYLYNPVQSVVTSVYLIMEITPGGGFIVWPRVKNFPPYDYNAGWMAFDVIFFLMWVLYVFRYWRDWAQTSLMKKSRLVFFMNLWNILQFVNLTVFLFVFGFYAYFIALCAGIKDIDVVASTPEYPTTIASATEVYTVMTYLNAVNVVISFVLLLKYAQLNNQLNLLQRTVLSAIAPLISVLMLFVLIVVAYGIAGTLLFGNSVAAYRNISYAIVSNFRALMGDFNYLSMWVANRAFAFVYFWSFIILALFMMLNFIVAVLMGGFVAEKAKTKRRTTAQILRDAVLKRGAGFATFKLVVYTTFTGRSMPEDLMYDSLFSLIRDSIDSGFEEDPMASPMNRREFQQLLLKPDQDTFGIKHVDLMWMDVVTAFENSVGSSAHAALQREKANQVYTGARDAAVAVLVDCLGQLTSTHKMRVLPSLLNSAKKDIDSVVFNSEAEKELVATRLLSSQVKPTPYTMRRGARRRLNARSIHEAVVDLKAAAGELHYEDDQGEALGGMPNARRTVDNMISMRDRNKPVYELPTWN